MKIKIWKGNTVLYAATVYSIERKSENPGDGKVGMHIFLFPSLIRVSKITQYGFVTDDKIRQQQRFCGEVE